MLNKMKRKLNVLFVIIYLLFVIFFNERSSTIDKLMGFGLCCFLYNNIVNYFLGGEISLVSTSVDSESNSPLVDTIFFLSVFGVLIVLFILGSER